MEAKRLYEEILKSNKTHVDVLQLLGLIHHQANNSALAERLLAKAIRLNPKVAMFHYNYGLVLHGLGRFREAVQSYDRAITLKADYAEAHLNRGLTLHELGHFDEALKGYDHAIALRPDYAEAYSGRGSTLQALKRLDEAVASFDRAITLKPDYVEAHYNRGNALQELSHFDAALASYDRAIALKSDFAEAYSNRGSALQALKRLDEAVASFDHGITLKPNYVEAHYNRGNALQEIARFDAALASYDRAIALKLDFAEAYSNRGSAFKEMKRFNEALASCDRAIAINANYAEAHCNRGSALKELRRFDDAVAALDHAIALKPDLAEAYYNRGLVLQELKRFGEALADYDRAIELKPDLAEAHWNKGMMLLSIGDYKNGWPLYEWRWKVKISASERLITSKMPWAGAEDKRVLVWPEQGVGDELMFSSLLPELQKVCSKVIARVDARLIPLLARSMSKQIIFVPANETVNENEYDEHISMGSLCQYFRADESSFAMARNGYLADDKERTDSIRKALRTNIAPQRKLCGISWRSKNEKNGADRSLDLRAFVTMLALDNVDFVNLQYGDTAEEIERVRSELNVNVLSYREVDNFSDIDGLASLIQACDLVVSIDNTTVHLAGALGQDTRVLLPLVADWRWLADRDDSPWYASVRLYRQDRDRNWAGAFQNVRADLSRL